MASLSVTPTSDVETREAVDELAEELENFAFERERILVKLDIRAAGVARRIARELRVVLRGLAVASDRAAHDAVHETLGALLDEAHRLLEDVQPAAPRASAPPVSGPSTRPAAVASGAPASASTVEDMSPTADAADVTPMDDDVPLESGSRPIDGEDDVCARHTAHDLGAAGLPRVSDDPDDPEESPEDLTIARRVMWERSGNRILGR